MINYYDIIIVGAGPGGLFSALNLPKELNTLILEKNSSVGKKLLMSGSGRCNFTHSGNIDEFFLHYGDKNNFVKPSLLGFTNNDLIEYVKKHKIEIVIDKNGKVFPKSQKAKDILDCLIKDCYSNNVNIHLNEKVIEIKKVEDNFVVCSDKNTYKSKFIILATGGKSYPNSGSTGDGYRIAETFGHTIITPKPALTPIIVKNFKFSILSGVSLYNREVVLYKEGKKRKSIIGDIVFTHFGLSGPAILDLSRYIDENDIIKINLLNDNFDNVSKKYIDLISTKGGITLKTFFKGYNIPERLIDEILLLSDIQGNVKISKVNKEIRNKIIRIFCEMEFEVERKGDFNIAMVTTGGVSIKEINSKTMESKIIPGFYFVGEVIDVDGDTGGYNLQFAFSSAYLAAKHIKINQIKN